MSKKIRLFFDILSCGGKSPAVFFLHGFLGRGDDWRGIAKMLARDYRPILIDLPGHGASISRTFHRHKDSFRAFAKDLIDLKKTLKVKGPVAVVGYSLGARLALYAATEYPGEFGPLVLESVNPGLQKAEDRRARLAADKEWARELQKRDLSWFLDKWYEQDALKTLRSDRARYLRLKKNRLKNDPPALNWALMAFSLGAQSPLWSKLAALPATLYITGKKDAKFSKISGQALRLTPRGEHRIIAGAGHNCHLERKSDYVKLVKKFLRSHIQ